MPLVSFKNLQSNSWTQFSRNEATALEIDAMASKTSPLHQSEYISCKPLLPLNIAPSRALFINALATTYNHVTMLPKLATTLYSSGNSFTTKASSNLKEPEIKCSLQLVQSRDTENHQDFLNSFSNNPTKTLKLSRKEEMRIAKILAEEDEPLSSQAEHILIRTQIKRVRIIAKQYHGRGLPKDDLIQEGKIGLIKGIRKFDHTRNIRLTSYVAWWIRQSIALAVLLDRNIHIPPTTIELKTRIITAQRKLRQRFFREPTLNEVSEYLKMSIPKIKDLISRVNKTISIDAPIKKGTNYGSIPKPIAPDFFSPNQKAETNERFDILVQIMEKLTPRERVIINMRYGREGFSKHTLEAVGNKLNLSKERIRQIEKQALNKLRNHHNINALRDFIV